MTICRNNFGWHYYRMRSSDSGSGFYQDLASRAGSVAVSLFSPVVSWIGGWVSDSQPIRQRSAASQVAESLLAEVIQQGRILEEQQNSYCQQEVSAVDYRYISQ